MIKDTITTNAVIDTLEVDILKENVSITAPIDNESKKYIKAEGNRKDKDSYFRLKLSPKHLIGYNATSSKHNTEEAIKSIAEEIGTNILNIECNRMDISIDSSLKYNDYVKLHLYLFELITFKDNSRGKMLCTNLNTLMDNNIYLNSRDLKLSIYDKALESNGTHPFQTRIEFRWCRYTSLDTEKSANKVIAKLKDIENNNAELTLSMVNRLTSLYHIELLNGSISNFVEFVKKYDKFFYTTDIIKGVYTALGYTGNFNNWFKYFKKTNPNFNYYSLRDIKKYKAAIVKSIKNYIKS